MSLTSTRRETCVPVCHTESKDFIVQPKGTKTLLEGKKPHPIKREKRRERNPQLLLDELINSKQKEDHIGIKGKLWKRL